MINVIEEMIDEIEGVSDESDVETDDGIYQLINDEDV